MIGRITLCAALLAGTATARDLWMVIADKSSVAFFDVDTQKKTKRGLQIWRDNYELGANDSVYLRFKALEEYDCANGEYRAISGILYNAAGEVEDSGKTGDGWEQIAPGTLGDVYLAFMCKGAEHRDRIAIRIAPEDQAEWARTALVDLRDGIIDGK
jgi:hypothetical protein